MREAPPQTRELTDAERFLNAMQRIMAVPKSEVEKRIRAARKRRRVGRRKRARGK